MRRWEVLAWFLLIAVVILLSFFFLTRDVDSPQADSYNLETVNPHARLAGNGSPLPSPAWEDLIVEQQQFDGRIFTFSYDQDTKNWQFDFFESGSQSLRYIADKDMFLYFNPFDLLWDEVDPDLLHEDYKQLQQTDEILLSAGQLDDFNRVAIEQDSVSCQRDEATVCAVWQAKNFLDHQEVFIHVNKRTRKIDYVVSFNPTNPTRASLQATYYYQPVEIEPPPIEKTRFLADD